MHPESWTHFRKTFPNTLTKERLDVPLAGSPQLEQSGAKSASPFTGSWRTVASANLRSLGSWGTLKWSVWFIGWKWSVWFIGWNNFEQVLELLINLNQRNTYPAGDRKSMNLPYSRSILAHLYPLADLSISWLIYLKTWSKGIPKSITHRRWFGITLITGVDTSPSSLQLYLKRSRWSRKGRGLEHLPTIPPKGPKYNLEQTDLINFCKFQLILLEV